MASLAAMLTAATVFLFKNQTLGVFGAWCGLCGTIIPAYHYLNVRDSKEQDACSPSSH